MGGGGQKGGTGVLFLGDELRADLLPQFSQFSSLRLIKLISWIFQLFLSSCSFLATTLLLIIDYSLSMIA